MTIKQHKHTHRTARSLCARLEHLQEKEVSLPQQKNALQENKYAAWLSHSHHAVHYANERQMTEHTQWNA